MSDNDNILKPLITDFVTWCSETEHELPIPDALKDGEEDITAENRKRTGAKEGLYPKAYFSGQYADSWKVPAAADSVYYQSANKK